MKKLLLLALCAILSANADARTLYVNAKRPNNSGNGLSAKKAKKTIQAAINAAQAGDTILVYPGQYAPIKTKNRKLVVKGVKGASKTSIVKSAKTGQTVTLATLSGSRGWNYSSKLVGVTLDGRKRKGSFVCGAECGTLKSCVIKDIRSLPDEDAYNNGSFVASGCTMTGCRIVGNEWSGDCMLAGGTLSRCRVENNTYRRTDWESFLLNGGSFGWSPGGAIAYNTEMYNCLVAGNAGFGGQHALFDGYPYNDDWSVGRIEVYNCTIVGNTMRWDDEDDALFSGRIEFVNCIVRNNGYQSMYSDEAWDDEAGYNRRSIAYGPVVPVDLSTCTESKFKTTLKGNKNPRFRNAAAGDYRLAKGSPCIDKGKLTNKVKKLVGSKDLAGRKRVRGKAIDIGCYEY